MSIPGRCFTLILFFTIHISSYSQWGAGYPEKKFEIKAGPEFRQESFNWSIDGTVNGKYVNVLSELKYKPLRASGFYLDGSYRILEKLSVTLSYNKLFTVYGKATDFDYDGYDRTEPVVQLHLKSNKGDMRHLKTTFLYQFVKNTNYAAGIGVGYSRNKELFYLFDDNNKALRSTYKAQWNGPLVQMAGLWNATPGLFVNASLRGNFFKYHAQANWNLIETMEHPVSFEHAAQGAGLDFDLGLGYRINRKVTAGIEAAFATWSTRKGSDKLYLTSGSILTTNMNGAHKNNVGIRALLGYSF